MKRPIPDIDGLVVGIAEVFYDGKRYFFNNGTKYIPLSKQSLKSQLIERGIENVTSFINKVETENYVEYAGPLAGKTRGLHRYQSNQLLATSSPEIIESKEGGYPTIERFIGNLLGGDQWGSIQIHRFYGWMKSARMAVLQGIRRPGQALVLAGPPDCGKTQLIDSILVPALGGRSGKAFGYLTSATRFNSELVGAEVLVADDETRDTHFSSRRAFGEGIKGALFSADVHMEGKFRDAFNFPLVWRVVIALNDDHSSLLVLPTLSTDIKDKLMIFRCQKGLRIAEGEFDQWKARIKEELPFFLNAVENFLPEEDGPEFARCGVSSFQHPHIVAALEATTPENQLLSLIDSAGPVSLEFPWEGTASQLQALLTSRDTPGHVEASALLKHPLVTGRLLAALVEDPASGVAKLTVHNGTQRYRIDRSSPSEQEVTLDDCF